MRNGGSWGRAIARDRLLGFYSRGRGESLTEVMPRERSTAAKLPTQLSKHLGVGAKPTPTF
jgi:hypothetical protein